MADSPSELIDARIAELGDWRGETLARVRAIVKAADPEVEETWKWRGVPVWEHSGIICTEITPSSRAVTTTNMSPPVRGAAISTPSSIRQRAAPSALSMR